MEVGNSGSAQLKIADINEIMKRSRPDLSIDVVIHRYIFKNRECLLTRLPPFKRYLFGFRAF